VRFIGIDSAFYLASRPIARQLHNLT
jgi:hypothetical protein